MLFDKIVHGPILQSVITEVGQLAPQDAAKLAVSLAGHYQRNPVVQGLHVNSAGIWTLGEEHHILPKSDGGTNHPSNMVVLPVSQHFYVHVLLAARGSMCQVIAASLKRPIIKKGKGRREGRRKSRKSRSWLQKGGRIFFERLMNLRGFARGSRKGKVCAVTRAALSH